MLTKELLKSNTKLSGLTDEQLTEIATLSQNDENSVIAKKVKDIHDDYDRDIKEITGRDKPGGVKSYDHLKQILTQYEIELKKVEDVDKLKQEVDTLKSENTELQKKIKGGSQDEALKKRVDDLAKNLADKQSELDQVKTTYAKEKEELQAKFKDVESKTLALELNNAFDSYVTENELKFKSNIDKDLLKETIDNRKKQLLQSLNPDMIPDGKGGQIRVFRDDKGEVMLNKDNSLNPFTAGELYFQRISDLVDPGKKQPGGGTTPPGGKKGEITNLDLSGANTQVEADKIIKEYVLKVEKISKMDSKFGERQAEIREEHKVSDLPATEES